ncbi:MAG: N-6 DNA methylase [Armatimonadetes bacterium]|nr:N-6 DNA methylase [Armatimonadota bacterium]
MQSETASRTIVSPARLGAEYEAALAADPAARRALGAWYTPPEAVRILVDASLALCLDAAERAGGGWAPFLALRVLDPAMGAGAFLLAAGEAIAARMLAGEARPERVAAARRAVAEACLFGVDTDPQAVQVARCGLREAFGAAPEAHLRCADSLRLEPAEWPAGGFHAVVGNPPYLSVKRGHLAAAAVELRARYRLAAGQWDAYMLFVELGLALLKSGGRLGYVLPRPALVNDHAEPLRRHIHGQGGLVSVVDLGRLFAAADVETVAVVVAKGAAPTSVAVGALEGGAVAERATVPTDWLRRRPRQRLPLGLSEPGLIRLETMDAAPTRLGDVATVVRGLEIGKRHRAVVGHPRPGAVPLLRGADVSAWQARPAAWLRPDSLERGEVKDPALFAPRPKLLVRRVAARPVAAWDDSGAWVLNTLYVVRPRAGEVDSAWLAAVLNSAAAAWWMEQTFGVGERLFPYLRQHQLEALPLPEPDRRLAELARRMAAGPNAGTAAEIDARVAAAYGLPAPA